MLGLGLRKKIQSRLTQWFGNSDSNPGPGSENTSATRAAPSSEGEVPGQEGALNAAAVQAILDEMVRPALQSDGGDIALVKVEDNDVHVRLVGACSSCPSSTVTMKMGVERLLREEFPQMRELVQVEAGW